MGTAISIIMVCGVVFFVIFAAKSKEHFQPKPLVLEQEEDFDDTACICDLERK